MNIRSNAFIALVVLGLLILFGFYSSTDHSGASLPDFNPKSDWPNRWELYDTLRKHGALLFIHNTDSEEQLAQYQEVADAMSDQRRWKLTTTLKKQDEVTVEDIKNHPILLIGAARDHRWIKKLSVHLPVKIQERSFAFDKKNYERPGDVFKLSLYPNPLNPKLPLYLIVGNSEEAIAQMISREYHRDWRRFYRTNWNYEVFREGEPLVFGQYNEETWTRDPDLHFDFTDAEQARFQSDHFSFISYSPEVQSPRLQQMAETCEATFKEIMDFAGKTAGRKKIDYFIYPSIENKGLRLNNTDEAHIDETDESAHVVINEHFQGQQWQMENELLIRHLLGPARTRALEKGLGIYFTRKWKQKGYAYWAARLYQSGNLPALKDMFNNELFDQESDLVMAAGSGSLVAYMLEKYGKDVFLDRYSTWTPQEGEISRLEKEWREYLKKYPPALPLKRNKNLPYLKGFNFAHEGYSIYNGYGSRLASRSLDKLRSIHANAVAIVPYSYMRDPKKPSFIGFSDRAGSENDEAVLYSHYEAQKRGMTTLLKPQIWIGRGSWPGDVEMSSEEDWQQFFEHYYRWMRHYALLAEMHGFDMLCVGVEFAKATVTREKDWRELIRKLRGIYSGPMTYAANWGEEFENLQFWDELDYIGLDCYYPLSKNQQPPRDELDRHFKEVLSMIEASCRKFDKPMIFTEIGFRSVEGTWTQPHEADLGRPFSEECQNICYDVVMENLKGKTFCEGLLWWKWSCNLYNRERENTGFTPHNKLAEKTVKKWFERIDPQGK